MCNTTSVVTMHHHWVNISFNPYNHLMLGTQKAIRKSVVDSMTL